jgi:hypothetical protein
VSCLCLTTREFLDSEIKKGFETEYPDVEVKEVFAQRHTEFKGNRHPGVLAHYEMNGVVSSHHISVRNYSAEGTLHSLSLYYFISIFLKSIFFIYEKLRACLFLLF